MDEHLWSHCYFIVLRSGTSWQRKKLQMSQNTDFHFAICRFRKYRFSFPFANCSKPFFLIQCLSQFLKLIVRPPLNYSCFFLRPRLWKWKPFFFCGYPSLLCFFLLAWIKMAPFWTIRKSGSYVFATDFMRRNIALS